MAVTRIVKKSSTDARPEIKNNTPHNSEPPPHIFQQPLFRETKAVMAGGRVQGTTILQLENMKRFSVPNSVTFWAAPRFWKKVQKRVCGRCLAAFLW